MTDVTLIHASKKYADELIEAERDLALTDGRIKTVIFNCWKEAYAKGYSDALNAVREDMGK